MGMTGSISILWMQYVALSCIVLATGYMAFRWLPSTLRWGLVGLVAGMILLPWPFSEGATATEEGFSGWAPAIIVTVINVLHHRISSALIGLVAASVAGALIGMLLGRRDTGGTPKGKGQRETATTEGHGGRKEPSL